MRSPAAGSEEPAAGLLRASHLSRGAEGRAGGCNGVGAVDLGRRERRRLEGFAASFRRYLGAYAPYSVSRLRENGSERLRIRPSGRRQLRPSEKTPGRNHISLAKYY